MKADARLGVFEDVVANVPAETRAIMEFFRNLIAELHEDAIEVARPGERSVGYGVGPKKMSETYAYIMPHGEYVNLGFYQGAILSDPNALLEGTGKALRHVKVRSLLEAQNPALRVLILESIAERKTALGLS
jgi:Domain of unknown function (DU1801)